MKIFKWQAGRQKGCEYKKFPLWFFRIGNFGFDAYILKYSPNNTLDWHTDPVKEGKHYRINIKIKGKTSFVMRKDGIYKSRWL